MCRLAAFLVIVFMLPGLAWLALQAAGEGPAASAPADPLTTASETRLALLPVQIETLHPRSQL